MNLVETNIQVEARADVFLQKADSLIDGTWGATQPRPWMPRPGAIAPAQTLESMSETLVANYLAACMEARPIPLKEFMDGFEKAILLASLRLTLGNQREASAILGIKPTGMFEKMRKHCINGRQMKLSKKLVAEPTLAVE